MGKHSKQKHHKSFKSRHKRRTRTKKPVKLKYEEPDELKRAPHSFVIHRGTVGKYILELEKDFRKVMDPFTASQLQVQKKNTLKDFVSVSSLLKVSHLIIFTNSAIGPYMRIARLPQGPTLMFRVHNYSLGRDVLSSLKKQMTNKKLYTNAPLVILNNFTGDGPQIKLMASVFQNMFPTINVTKVNLADIRRCVMLNYNTETKMIDFRHYAIKAVPVGISRSVKKIVQSKVPNLAKYEDFSEFLTKPSMMSESEAEDDPNSHVEVPQKLPSRGNMISQQSSIRLSELGPRLTLQLLKVEDGLLNGDVIFHELVKKTEEEKRLIRKRLAEKRRLKEERKRQQEANVKKKEIMKEEHKKKSIEGMKRKLEQQQQQQSEENEVEDDVEYFREETGLEPDEGVFGTTDPSKTREYGFKRKNKKQSDDLGAHAKKRFRKSITDDRSSKKNKNPKFRNDDSENHSKNRFRKSAGRDGSSKKNKFNKNSNFKNDDRDNRKRKGRREELHRGGKKMKRPSKLVNKVRKSKYKK